MLRVGVKLTATACETRVAHQDMLVRIRAALREQLSMRIHRTKSGKSIGWMGMCVIVNFRLKCEALTGTGSTLRESMNTVQSRLYKCTLYTVQHWYVCIGLHPCMYIGICLYRLIEWQQKKPDSKEENNINTYTPKENRPYFHVHKYLFFLIYFLPLWMCSRPLHAVFILYRLCH